MNPKVDFYFKKGKWQKELAQLRTIVLDCPALRQAGLPTGELGGLAEELKWGVPCYTFKNNNIVLIHVFKEYCAILFFKGALLGDPDGILIQQTEHVQATRQIRFTNVRQIIEMKAIIKAYIFEAIEVEKAGLKVEFKETAEFAVPEEFQQKLENAPMLKAAFDALTPGRKRGYLLYFSAPKQSKTRESRIEKCMQRIFEGKGLSDR